MKSLSLFARIIALFVVCVAMAAPSRAKDDGSVTIRAFDIATIEKLGRQMYDQDQFAWKATDALRAAHDLRAENIRGWLVETLPDRTRVLWIRDNSGTLEAAYDVDFVGSAAPAIAKPDSPALTDAERVQFAARQLAIQNIGHGCFESYNTIVLKDPDGDGWLVWALGTTTDPNAVVIGGHIRFTVSADGKTIQRTDRLSRSCMVLSKQSPQGNIVALMTTHLVSNTPVETHVFESLQHHMAIYVGTQPDGKLWEVNGDHIRPVDK